MHHHTPVHKAVVKHWRPYLFFLEIVAVVVVYTVILALVRSYAPDAPDIIEKIKGIYGSHGYDLIFWGALLEGTFVVGFYVPGSLIILLGAALAQTGVVSFPLVVLLGTLGLVSGYVINYTLGRFGWYRIISGFGLKESVVEAKKKLIKYQDKAMFVGYSMPSTGSFLSTAAGILKLNFKNFLLKSFIIQIFWSIFLGGLAYFFGLAFIDAFLRYFIFIFLAGVLVYLIKEKRRK